jgi:glutathione synthase/RimK-type ligase-like ATP-grasp enzyme
VILVVSYPDEDHTLDVVGRLEQAGREVVQIDLSDFPARSGLALSWADGQTPAYVVARDGRAVDLREARVAWWRRVRPFDPDPQVASPSLRAFAASETGQAVGGMLNALPCAWVNPRAQDDAAHHKPYQWEIAQQVGLRLPRTLVTNQPEEARAFIEQIGVGRVVFKAFLASIEAWRETRLVEAEDVERLEQVRYAPVIFQEYVEGVDLRITAVGDRLFPCEIDARNTSYPADMRMVVGESVVQPAELPAGLHDTLMALQRRLGLYYGAIDMRRTPDGEYVFFEVNPAGQWLFVERLTGMPIGQAVADLLAGLEDHPETWRIAR